MRRFRYNIYILLFSQLLLSCGDSCGCKKSDNAFNTYFDINGLEVGFTDQPENTNYADTSIQNFTITQDSSIVNVDNASLLVLFKIAYVARNKTNFSLINSAYACSPAIPGQNGSHETIDSFYVVPIGRFGNDSVYADTLYNISHPDFILLHHNATISPFNFVFITGGIGKSGDNFYINRTKIYFKFNRLFATPDFTGFKIVLKLKNGERYEETTKKIKLI